MGIFLIYTLLIYASFSGGQLGHKTHVWHSVNMMSHRGDLGKKM
jgi:hypothetical protein